MAATAAAALIAAMLITTAVAVHDEEFQLEGDVLASTPANPAFGADFDWSSFFNNAGQPSPVLPAASRPGFDASGFDRDFRTNQNGTFNTADGSTFATGSKDTLAITPGWQCNFDNNVNSKIDVMNAYAVAYTDPDTDHEILYFGLERNTNTGTANVGFWFLQDEVACESTSGTSAFTGDHADGDLLIVSEFSNGGTVSTINVYRWNGGANGTLGTTPVASGVDCRGANLGNDTACGAANTADITTPWLTSNFKDGTGNKLRVSEAFEGGVDLTAANLDGKCFNTFIGDTRSSTSLTATLFDFSLGQLGSCTSSTVTTPVDSSGNEIDPNDPSSRQITIPTSGSVVIKDRADITVDGADTFAGTVTFSICGPTAVGSTDLCTTGGKQIGSPKAVTTSPAQVTSDGATITSVGRYCWRADFSGDAAAGVPPSSDSAATECFTVLPVQPTLDTQATAAQVDFGQPISDTATLSGTAKQPGTGGTAPSPSINPTTPGANANGTITFTAYGPDNCTTVAYTSQPVTVNGDGNYGGAGTTAQFTPTAPGTYHWVASYTGDAPNTLGTSHNTQCTDSDESVVVRQIPTTIATAQSVYPNDSATINSSVAGENLPTGGTVVFRLYGPTGGQTPKTALQNCAAHGDTVGSGGLLYKQTLNNVGGDDSVTVNTTNTSVAVNDSETYYWRVTYNPNDSAFTGRQSDCLESTDLTFLNDAGPGTLFP